MGSLRCWLLIMTITVALICSSQAPGEEADNPWRAGAEVLCQRVERLAAGGEVDAAAAVLQRLLEREDIEQTGLDDRARLALARGYLAAERIDEALATVHAISWADKAPEVAAQVVSLQLAIRWQGLHDGDGRLRSGMIPPRDSVDAVQGQPLGPWQERRVHWQALGELLAGGVRMVAAEGGELRWPRPQAWLDLVRYAYNQIPIDELPALATGDAEWLGALASLHLEEHEITAAWAVSQELLRRFPNHAATEHALYQLALWQLRRERLATNLPLWPLSTVEAGVTAALAARPDLQQRARAQIENEAQLLLAQQEWPQERELREVAEEVMIEAEFDEPAFAEIEVEHMVWALARSYEGLQLLPKVRNLAIGEEQELQLISTLRGPHEVQLYALESLAAYQALAKDPVGQAHRLQGEPLQRMVVNYYGDPGEATSKSFALEESSTLAEGFYALRVSARGSPVVAVSGFSVVDPDLHVLAGRESLQVWVVSRASGAARPQEPLAIELSLVRNPAAAAGAAWADASAPWRAGFRAAFLDEYIAALIRDEDQAQVALGRAAGRAARELDPPQHSTHFVTSDASGLARLDLPAAFHARPYHALVRIDRGDVAVAREVSHGIERSWSQRSLAWADRPLLRPGETLHWRALLREFDGSRLRRPEGRIAAAIRIIGQEEQILWQEDVTIADDGSLHGSLTLPISLRRLGPSSLQLRLGEGAWRHLAKVRELALPDFTLEVAQSNEFLRSGEDQVLTLTLRDAHGAGIADTPISADILIHPLDGPSVPGQRLSARSDLGGVARLRVPSLPGQPALYRATLQLQHAGQNYLRHLHWRASVFPFPLQVELRESTLRAGHTLHLRGTFPAAARLQWWLEVDGRRLGEVQEWQGDDRGWSETRLPLTDAHVGATAVVLSHPVLDGPPARRELSLRVNPAPSSRELRAGELRLEPSATRVDPGQAWSATLRGLSPRAAGLLVIGDDMLRLAAVANCDPDHRGHATFRSTIDPTWGPSTQLQAVSYVPGRGFVESPRQALEIRPIDTLLRVTVQPEHASYRPGDALRARIMVHDWQGHPAAGVHLSVGVVDQRLYHLTEDETPDLWEYFHRYQRPWQLSLGTSISQQVPQALLWRAVIQRWQPLDGGAFGNRVGGGKRRALGSYGGSRASESASVLLEASTSPLVLWLADIQTDAQGVAHIRFSLPNEPGSWRLTARANDAAERLRVGEVRHDLSAQLSVQAHLRGPSVMTPGEQLPLEVELHNRQDAPTTVRLQGPDGQPQELELPERGRRTLQLAVHAPALDPEVPLRWDAGHLGQLQHNELRLTSGPNGAEVQELRFSYLLRLPGMIDQQQLLSAMPEDGRMTIAEAAQAAHVELHAFADGGARARHWLSSQPRQALAVLPDLLKPAGPERLQAVASAWPAVERLGRAPVALLLAQIAHQQGMPMAAPHQRPAGLQGAWLLARAQRLGMDLPRPARSLDAGSGDERALRAATAQLAGWREAPDLWPQSLHSLSPFALAVLADAAQLTEHPQAEVLAQAIAAQPWNDALTNVLAVLVLHQRPALPPQAVVLDDGLGGEHPLALGAEVSWTGRLGPQASLRAAPGTILLGSVRALHAADDEDPGWLTMDWYQPGADGLWYEVPADDLRPGRDLLLRLRLSAEGRNAVHNDSGLEIRGLLPFALEASDTDLADIAVVEALKPRWALDGQWANADPELPLPLHAEAQPRLISPTELADPDARLWLYANESDAELPVEQWLLLRNPDHEAQLRWPVLRLGRHNNEHWDGGPDFALAPINEYRHYQPAPLILRGGTAPSWELADDALDFPYPETLHHLLPRLSNAERQALATEGFNTGERWQYLLRIYDSDQQHHLEDLLAHGLIGEDHWSSQRLAEQAAQSWAQLLGDGPRLQALVEQLHNRSWDLVALLELRQRLSTLADHTLKRLPPDQRPELPIPTVRELVAILIPAVDNPSAWLWQQDLPAVWLHQLVDEPHGEAWLYVLREVLGLPLHLDPALPPQIFPPAVGDSEAFAGPRLGSDWLAEVSDLRLIPLPATEDGQVRYRLTTLTLPAPGPWGLRVNSGHSSAAIIDHLALLHRNRGLPSPRLSPRLARDPRTLHVNLDLGDQPLPITAILRRIATHLDAPLQRIDGAWVIGEE